MADLLTTSAVKTIFEQNQTSADGFTPCLQVLNIKLMESKQNTAANQIERYRLILSDGVYFLQAMLAVQNNAMLKAESPHTLAKFSVIKLNGFSINEVMQRKIVIALDVQVVAQHHEKIGSPVNIDAAAVAAAKQPKETDSSVGGPGLASGRQNAGAVSSGPGGNPPGRAQPAGPIYPIGGLSPYQNKWTIKARVTARSEIKHWTNARGEGKLFSVNLLDESGEIKATGFNDACDRFYSVLEEGKVFFISKARVNIAKKQFSNIQNEYEITLESSTEIEPCHDQVSVPTIKYSFVPLDKLTDVEKDGTCDVIGLVKDVGDLTQITSKSTQRPVSKRELTLVDQSAMSVRLTLWGRQAEAYNDAQGKEESIIAFKGVKVSDFGGRSLSMFSSSTMTASPDINEAHALRGWYDAQGKSKTFSAYTSGSVPGANGPNGAARANEVKTLSQVKDDQLGYNETVDYFTTRATVIFIRQENLTYPACPGENCNKKVTLDSDGWRCEKCSKTYPAPDHRYVMSFSVNDHTGQIWLSTFNDIGQRILGIPANEYYRLKEEGNDNECAAILHRATGKMWSFSCRAKQDNYNDVVRVRHTVTRADPVDFVTAGKQLTEMIEQYDQMMT